VNDCLIFLDQMPQSVWLVLVVALAAAVRLCCAAVDR
jgi:hypothetical protein